MRAYNRIDERCLTRVAVAALLIAAVGAPRTWAAGDDPAPVRDPAAVIHRVSGAGGRPPNIIVILADDLGYGDLGSYGGRAIRTPNLDGLAQQGARFTDFHASDSVCTPSRAGLLTGRYSKRMGLDVPLPAGSQSLWGRVMLQLGYLSGKLGLMDLATEGAATGLHANEITLPEALKVAGYATGMVGKWHLGDYAVTAAHDPRRHGFDWYTGVPYSNDMHPFPLYRNGQRLEADITDQSKLTRLYTEAALSFIETSRDRPFFLYLAHTFPHRPLHASAEFKNRSAGGLYGDTVEELDASVGQLLAALRRYNLDGNTVVMFSSDNGPWYDGSPGALRGRKGQSWEGGYRVPFLARWPGHIPAGLVSRAPTMNIDLFPTCLALAGLEPPTDRIVDGKNLTPLLTVPNSPTPDEYLFFYHQGELEGIRAGKWKYIRSINHYVWPMPVNKVSGRMSEHTTGPLPLLFDLETDPGEAYDVSGKYPDVARRLADRMAQWDEELRTNRKGWKR